MLLSSPYNYELSVIDVDWRSLEMLLDRVSYPLYEYEKESKVDEVIKVHHRSSLNEVYINANERIKYYSKFN